MHYTYKIGYAEAGDLSNWFILVATATSKKRALAIRDLYERGYGVKFVIRQYEGIGSNINECKYKTIEG